MKHPILKLPSIDHRVVMKADELYIFDPIRKKELLLTPEEWVRQHFVSLLVTHLGYPAGRVQLERQHVYFKSTKRSDIVILDAEGHPNVLVECKAYDVRLNEQTLSQISGYNKILKAPIVAITNGMQHFVWSYDEEVYEQLDNFPPYTG